MPAETDPATVPFSSRRTFTLAILLSVLVHALVISVLLMVYSREPAHIGDNSGMRLDIDLNVFDSQGNPADVVMPAKELLPESVNVTDARPPPVPADSQPQVASDQPRIGDTSALLSSVAVERPHPVVPETQAPSETESKGTVDIGLVTAQAGSLLQTPMAAAELGFLEPTINQWISQAQWTDNQAPSMTVEHGGQQFDIVVSRAPASDATALNQIHIEVSTVLNGRRLSSSVQVREKAFSHYAKFVNHWDTDVSLSDDRVDGRFHSNSPINLADRGARPVFNGPVTVAARQSLGRRLRESIFVGGVETGARAVPLPRKIVLPAEEELLQPENQSVKVWYFDDDTHIAFQSNGDYVWHTSNESDGGREHIGESLAYLIARNNARLTVEGEVRGRVLVYAPRRITISGDLVYASDPTLYPDSEDFLGLISDGSVEIAESSVTGPGDLTIQAAIFARSRFSVRRFRDRAQGILRIFGSISAGSVSATEPRYATRIEHDTRLEARRPPSFPTTGHFELVSWDRQWHVEEPVR